MSIGKMKSNAARVKAREPEVLTEVHRLLSMDKTAQYLGIAHVAFVEKVEAGKGPRSQWFGDQLYFREKDVAHFRTGRPR